MGFMSYLRPTKPEPTSTPSEPAPDTTEEKSEDERGRRQSSIIPIDQDDFDGANNAFERHAIRRSMRRSRAVSVFDSEFVPSSIPGSRAVSTRSHSPAPSKRSGRGNDMNDVKCDVMVNYLHQQQEERFWTSRSVEEGVVLKKSRGVYTCCPAELADRRNGFLEAVEQLNVRVAMTVNTRVINLFLQNNPSHSVPLSNGLRLQVLPEMSFLPRCQKHHFAAFIADRGQLVVWDDDPRLILTRAQRIEEELMEMIWQDDNEMLDDKEAGELGEGRLETWEDIERGHNPRRPIMLWQSFQTACCLMLTCIAIGAGWKQIAFEIIVDQNYTRLLFLLIIPAQIWLALFFFQCLVGNLMQMFGPVNQVNVNTKYYSGKPPKRLNRDFHASLPHVTVQMPVYKEGLAAVIEPTIKSIKAAISTYEMQGGSANIFINDDGMQLISEDEAQARLDFYDEHSIGWVSRPKHKPKPPEGEEPFLRRGKFKKASNMNYSMWVSNRVEDKLLLIQRHEKWTQEDEKAAYHECLQSVIAEDEGRTWAEGNIRMGDYILIIDSDTRVPTDCFLDAVSEMEQYPSVAIIQFKSGVMNVTTSFFEKGITFFTHLIYTAIRYAVANGDVAPFIGHNAILRWTSVQEVAYQCKHDGYEKYWSEETVSEDFDMALRLQTAGYICRFASYTGEGFKEGVSLTVYDELARWEKYAYGCSELIFHPFKDWIFKGPFTPLFRNFMSSSMPLPCKVTIMAYVGTYYAIASAWILTLFNYFAVGWFNGFMDHYYLDSFKIYFALILVFSALGNLALAILRYRIGEKNLIGAILENLRWIPVLSIFLGGISLHVSQAIISHMLGIDMSWGSTAKEAENTTFFQEMPKILQKFKGTLFFCFASTAMMIVLSHFVPYFWQIRLFIAVWPLATIIFSHFFLPVALNPNLMLFTW